MQKKRREDAKGHVAEKCLPQLEYKQMRNTSCHTAAGTVKPGDGMKKTGNRESGSLIKYEIYDSNTAKQETVKQCLLKSFFHILVCLSIVVSYELI